MAEAIGTFALILVGVTAISAAGFAGAPAGIANLASIGLAHGLTIAVMVAALGAVSGGHFNPAVTFGFVVTGRMTPATGVIYWVAQLVGAAIAGLLLAAMMGTGPVSDGTPHLGKKRAVRQRRHSLLRLLPRSSWSWSSSARQWTDELRNQSSR